MCQESDPSWILDTKTRVECLPKPVPDQSPSGTVPTELLVA